MNELLAVAGAAVLAQVLAAWLARFARIPLVVLEIVLGILIGPAVLGLVQDSSGLEALSDFGLAMLFFMAGSEVEFRVFRGRLLRRSVVGWLVSLGAGVGLGILFSGSGVGGVFIGIALCSTALGTLLPILIDTGLLRTPLGQAITAVGAVGEFGPLVAISIFLTSRSPGTATLVLLAFVVIAVAVVLVAALVPHPGMHRLITASLHTSGQFAIRFVVFLLVALVALSTWLDLDMLLGAFVAGVAFQYLLTGATPGDAEVVRQKLSGLAFGCLVPIFFITTGIEFDITALLTDPRSIVVMLVFLLALLVVRGIPGSWSAPAGATPRERVALGLMAATGLPIIVAVTNIALDQGVLERSTATALVGAGMLSVLLFPLLAVTVLGKPAGGRLPTLDGELTIAEPDPAPEPAPARDPEDGADGRT